jgi:hypothetical protein
MYWGAMAADVVIVLLFLRGQAVVDVAHSMMKGYVVAGVGLAGLAWLIPTASDLRLGDLEYFNTRATCKIIENRRRFRRTRALSCRRCSAAPFGRHLDTAEMRISIFGHAATVAVWS